MDSAIVIASDTVTKVNIVSHDTGLAIDPRTTYEEWAAYGRGLGQRYSALQWQIGDWINFGEAAYGETYAQALNDTDYAYGTLRNYASICARIPAENRTPKLRFHQTKHVAPLKPSEQKKIIDFAAAHNMTGEDILEAVQNITGTKKHAASIEGTIARSYHQEDGDYLVVRLAANNSLQTGQVVTLRVKA